MGRKHHRETPVALPLCTAVGNPCVSLLPARIIGHVIVM